MGKKREQQRERIDKKHRFPLRISDTIHCEVEALSFKHYMSLNLLYVEAIKYALASQGFIQKISENHERDNRKGHFVFLTKEH